MRKRTADGKSIPPAVIILAFFHWFSCHYGALSQEKALASAGAFFSYILCVRAADIIPLRRRLNIVFAAGKNITTNSARHIIFCYTELLKNSFLTSSF